MLTNTAELGNKMAFINGGYFYIDLLFQFFGG